MPTWYNHLGGPPALRSAPGRGQAVQGSASLPCCAPLPLVVPFPSFPHSPDTTVAQRDPVPRAGPPHFAPCTNAALRSSLLTSLFTQFAMAPVAAFGPPALPQIHPPGPLPAGQPAGLPPTHHTAAKPRKAPKRPSRRPSAPPMRPAGHRPENAGHRPLKSAFSPRRPTQ